ncbi:hypothetical protein [Streptomyces sp. NPDC048196]|uniref:hypothetical protein n=1 Tax=Streptomyces sp. NPDC048196 TaxID=3154712 RepID=UPI0033EA7528
MTTQTTTHLEFGHLHHPLLGRRVIDHGHDDRVGILRALAPDPKDNNPGLVLWIPDTPPVAWLSPVGGGVEWTTGPDQIEAAP